MHLNLKKSNIQTRRMLCCSRRLPSLYIWIRNRSCWSERAISWAHFCNIGKRISGERYAQFFFLYFHSPHVKLFIADPLGYFETNRYTYWIPKSVDGKGVLHYKRSIFCSISGFEKAQGSRFI